MKRSIFSIKLTFTFTVNPSHFLLLIFKLLLTQFSVLVNIWFNFFLFRSFHFYYTALVSDSRFSCDQCLRSYKHAASLYNHVKYECGKAPVFSCDFCPYRAKRKHCLKDHLRGVHHLDPNV